VAPLAAMADDRDGVGRDGACLNTITAAAMAATTAMAATVAVSPPTPTIDKADTAPMPAVPPVAAAAPLAAPMPAPTPPSDTPPAAVSAPPAPPLALAAWDTRIGPALESSPALSMAGTVSGSARSSLRLSLHPCSCAAQIAHCRACASARACSSSLPSRSVRTARTWGVWTQLRADALPTDVEPAPNATLRYSSRKRARARNSSTSTLPVVVPSDAAISA